MQPEVLVRIWRKSAGLWHDVVPCRFSNGGWIFGESCNLSFAFCDMPRSMLQWRIRRCSQIGAEVHLLSLLHWCSKFSWVFVGSVCMLIFSFVLFGLVRSGIAEENDVVATAITVETSTRLCSLDRLLQG